MSTMGILDPTEQHAGTGKHTLGVVVADRLYAGLTQNNALLGSMQTFPEGDQSFEPEDSPLVEFHTEALVEAICELSVRMAGADRDHVSAFGLALPGLVRNGVVEEAPNLPQLKGARIGEMLHTKLAEHGIHTPVCVSNDADAMAAGLAAKYGKLDQRIRVWTLGTGIGYGTWPPTEGVWENGHMVVSLDDRENYCGCGGRGHLEGIMGHRAMRLRFLDMEPEEVFAAALRRSNPDHRCVEFRNLWHKALAAGTASSIHAGGAGRFFFTGYNVRFLDLNLLRQYMDEMVKMSPLQSYQLEIVEDEKSTRVIGAAVMAEQVSARC